MHTAVKPTTLGIMAIRAIEISAIGRRVAANLTALREHRRLSQTDLSERLGRLGRQIASDSISKIEKLGRRVDVDDLVALAVALDTTPNRLLLPGAAGDEPAELTPEVTVSALEAWQWATGERALPGTGMPLPAWQGDDRERLFTRENQPHNLPEPYFRNVGHDVREHPDVVRIFVAALVAAREHDMQIGAQVRLLEHLDIQLRFGQLGDLLSAISGTGNGKPLIQPVVAVIVTSGEGVLAGRRNEGNPPWTFIAGEIEPGERPEDAAVREVPVFQPP